MRCARKDLVDEFVETAPLLDPEVGRPEIQVQVGGVADGGNVAGTVPGGANAVHAGKYRRVTRGCEATHLADVHSDKVNQPVLDERGPLSGVVEEFPHGNGRGALLPYAAEPFQVLRGERVLQKEKLEGFNVFRELDCVCRDQAFVDVVEEFNVPCGVCADMPDHVEHPAGVFPRVIIRALLRTFRFTQAGRPAAVPAHLHANVLVALFVEFQDVVEDFVPVSTVGVCVTGSGFAAFAAQQLIDGHARALALDVPQSDIDAGNRVVEDGAVAPVSIDHTHLPDVFNAVDVASDEKGFDVSFKGGVNGMETLRERGAPEAVETGFRSDHFDHDEA